MNLPPVHGYGVPQILSQWQAGQNRKQKKEQFNKGFKLREDQFKLQEKEYTAKKEQLEVTRKSAAFDNFVKMFDTGIKHLKDPRTKKFGLTLTSQAVERYNAANPNSKIDISNFTTGEEITEEMKKHSAENLDKTYKVAMESGTGKDVGEFYLAKKEYEKYHGKGTVDLEVKVRKATDSKGTANAQDFEKWKSMPEGDEKDALGRMLKINASEATPTDYDDEAERFKAQWKIDNPNQGEPPPGLVSEAVKSFKRPNAQEVGDKEEAKYIVKQKYVSAIKFAEEEGKMLAQIKNNADLIESKGEVTGVQKKEDANKRLSGVLAGMAEHYSILNAKKAIVNVDNTTSENIIASLGSSMVGQYAQKVVGTETQSLRNSIKNSQPLLINFIRQASEMGARGLDSEKELSFYLQAATDPTRDIQSNIAAMVILDEAYGTGELSDTFRKTLDINMLRRMKKQGAGIKKSDKNKGSKPATWGVFKQGANIPISELKEITTQKEYDALESGDVYLENGQQFRKP